MTEKVRQRPNAVTGISLYGQKYYRLYDMLCFVFLEKGFFGYINS